MTTVTQYNIFPTPIRVIDLDADTVQRIKEFYEPTWDDIPYNEDIKVRTTWGVPDLCKLAPDLLPAIQVGLNEFIPQVDNFVEQCEIGDYWQQDYGHGASHAPHTHPNSVVSGVYYIESNGQGSPLVFYNQNSVQHFKNYATYSSAVESYEGRLILFPSWLLHGVPENRNKDVVRRVVAFNLDAVN